MVSLLRDELHLTEMEETYPFIEYGYPIIDISTEAYDPERYGTKSTGREEVTEEDIKIIDSMLAEYTPVEKDLGYLVALYEKNDIMRLSLINYQLDPISFFDSRFFTPFRLGKLETTDARCPLYLFASSPTDDEYLLLSLRVIARPSTTKSIGIITKSLVQTFSYNASAYIVFYFKKIDVLKYLNDGPAATALIPDYEVTQKYGYRELNVKQMIELIAGRIPAPARKKVELAKYENRPSLNLTISALKFDFGASSSINIEIFSYVIGGRYKFERRGIIEEEDIKNDYEKDPASKKWKKEPYLKVDLSIFENNISEDTLASACIITRDLERSLRDKFSSHLRSDNLYIIARKIDLYHALTIDKNKRAVMCFGMTGDNKAYELSYNGNTPEMLFPTSKWREFEAIRMKRIKGAKISSI